MQDQPTVGVIDVAMALEAAGLITYPDKGNMTKAEIDKTIKLIMDLKKSGQFRSFWTSFDQSVNLMASGEVVIHSTSTARSWQRPRRSASSSRCR